MFFSGQSINFSGLLNQLKAPVWLANSATLIGALWLLFAFFMLHSRLRAERMRQAQDWLAALPIPASSRWQFIRAKIASLYALELLAGVLLVLWFSHRVAAIAQLAIGALIAAVYLIHAGRAKATAQTSGEPAKFARVRRSATIQAPLQAWFFGLMPEHAQLRWFWLLPLLLLPGATSVQMIGAAVLGFAAALRISCVSTAISRGNCQMTTLLDTSPLPAPKLYQASWRFAAQAILPLLLIAGLIGMIMPLKLVLPAALLTIVFGALATLSQLHFSFAFRYLDFPQPSNHSEASAKARAWLIFLLVAALLIRELAPLLPIFCLLSWRWLYRRGLAAVTGKTIQNTLSRL